MSDGLKLLGAIIDTGSFNILRDVQRDLLIDDEPRLYDFIRSHYRRYGTLPSYTAITEEVGIEVPEAEEVPEYYIQRVRDRHTYTVYREQFQALRDAMRTFDVAAAKEIVDSMQRVSRSVNTAVEIKTFGEAVLDVQREYQFAHENPGVSGVPFGWPRYDYVTGGAQPGDLITIVARPSMGKTYLMLRAAKGAWKLGYSVLVVTMEMTIAQLARRLAAVDAGINPDYVRKGTLSKYAERRLQTYIDQLSGCDNFRFFAGGLSRKTSDVELLVQEFRPDIVFIDGVYLMSPENKRATSKTERTSEVFDELKRLTITQNVPVVVTTQFNRTAGKKGKEGSLENIAYTDAISTHSSLVLSVSEGDGSDGKRKRKLAFLKGREGEDGAFEINYKFSPVNFEEVSSDEGSGDEGSTAVATTNNLDWMG